MAGNGRAPWSGFRRDARAARRMPARAIFAEGVSFGECQGPALERVEQRNLRGGQGRAGAQVRDRCAVLLAGQRRQRRVGVEAMPAEFGLAMAVCVVVASMVGTGVLMTSGYTVASVGSNQYMLMLWVVGGVTAVCGALTLAELSAAMPRTGGDYVYLHEAYGPLASALSSVAA